MIQGNTDDKKEVIESLNCHSVSTYKVKTQKKLKKSTFNN